ncbi:RCC1 domain-containing protein [Paenibacillus sp. LS1]|uniref:RCC1 domain-containing protein n=1 Tax=Paenibacillus sp. LS1 TaxID=2992120 RepID=UPI0022321B0B|nr:RCC1 domain-containing protein [Paenibacillus sp. LS1]MCW3793836.1 RCC1 domain-containing protein [Paenibacillus sp. LS1]
MEKNEKKKKKKFSIGWKRSVILTLVVALILGSVSFADNSQKAQAAEFVKIRSIESYDDGFYNRGQMNTYLGTNIILDNGNAIVFNDPKTPEVFTGNYKKFERYVTGSSVDKHIYAYIDNLGDFYYKQGQANPTFNKLLSQAKDFVTNVYDHPYNAYAGTFILDQNENVWAMGYGTGGQLGIGYKQSKTVPTEVVDPETGDPLEGVKKIYYLSRKAVLLVTDDSAYLVGQAFGLNSLTKAVPIKLTIFPEFNTASDFDMTYVDGIKYSWVYNGTNDYPSSYYYNSARRVFTISGKQYSLSNLIDFNDHIAIPDETDKTTLLELPSDYDYRTIKKVTTQQYGGGHANTISSGYTILDKTNLYYWGSPQKMFGYINGALGHVSDRVLYNTGVTSSAVSIYGDVLALKANGNMYARGRSNGTGVNGGSLDSFIRVTGPANEVKDIKQFDTNGWTHYALKKDNTVISWYSDSTFKTSTDKYLGLVSVPQYGDGRRLVLGISEKGELVDLSTTTKVPGVSNLAPADYVAPVTAPEKPVLSVSSKDKFNQSIISVNYGTYEDITTKQVQINGQGWTNYTGEFLVTQSGNVSIEARSSDSKGNISEIGTLTITSDPIVISPGSPTITDLGNGEIKIESGTTNKNTKLQVKVGDANWQEHNPANNLLLQPGTYTIQARLLNDLNVELVNRSVQITISEPSVPIEVKKPVVKELGLTKNYKIAVELEYDTTGATAQYSIDNGAWEVYTAPLKLSNEVHQIKAKVIKTDGAESEITDYTTTQVEPKVNVLGDQVTIDLGVGLSELTLYYKDASSQWIEYTGAVTLPDGKQDLYLEVRDRNSNTPIFNGGPYTVDISNTNPNPGDGGTTPPVDPSPATPISDEEVDFTVQSGGLSSRFEGIDLSTIVIDSTNPYQQINSVSNAFIDDSTGRAGGWQYSLQITDFVSEPMYDSSTQEKGLVVSIPTNSFSVNVGSSKTLAGPENQLSNVGKKVFSTEAQVLALANPFEGMGYYQIPLNFTMSVPDRVKVVKSSDGSKYAPGQDTGLMAGVYKSTFTFTLTSGI